MRQGKTGTVTVSLVTQRKPWYNQHSYLRIGRCIRDHLERDPARSGAGHRRVSADLQLRPSVDPAKPVSYVDGGKRPSVFRCSAAFGHAHFHLHRLLAGHRGHGARDDRVFPQRTAAGRAAPAAASRRAHGAHDHPGDAAAVFDPAGQRSGRAAVLPHLLHRPHARPHGLSAVRGR